MPRMPATVCGLLGAGAGPPSPADAALSSPVPGRTAVPATTTPTRSAPTLHVPAERLLDLAAGVPLGEVVALVVALLALGQRQGGLDLAVLEVQVERDER